MNKRFSRIALVGKVEDARVADSMVALARHLRSRGLAVLVDRSITVAELPGDAERRPSDMLAGDADLIVAIGSKAISGPTEIERLLDKTKPGEDLSIEVIRAAAPNTAAPVAENSTAVEAAPRYPVQLRRRCRRHRRKTSPRPSRRLCPAAVGPTTRS